MGPLVPIQQEDSLAFALMAGPEMTALSTLMTALELLVSMELPVLTELAVSIASVHQEKQVRHFMDYLEKFALHFVFK